MSFEKFDKKINLGNEDGIEKFLTVDEFLVDKDFLGASLMGSKWAEYAGGGSQIRHHNAAERRDLIARIMTRIRKTDAAIETRKAADGTANTYKREDWEKGYEEYKKIYSRYQHGYK